MVAQPVKNPPAVQETLVWSLGQEDPLEERLATTPVFLPGEFHGQRSLVGYSTWGRKESDTTEWLRLSNLITRQQEQGIFELKPLGVYLWLDSSRNPKRFMQRRMVVMAVGIRRQREGRGRRDRRHSAWGMVGGICQENPDSYVGLK